MRHSAHVIQRAASAVASVKEIDETIEWLCRDVDRADKWGQMVRDAFGRDRLSQCGNEPIGQVTFCALVNELLEQRAEIVADFASIVEFPDAPCQKQVAAPET